MIETCDVIGRTWTPEKSGVDRGSGDRGTSATKHPSPIRFLSFLFFLWPVTFVFPEFVGPAMKAYISGILRTVPPIVSAHLSCASREKLPRARPRVSPFSYLESSFLTAQA